MIHIWLYWHTTLKLGYSPTEFLMCRKLHTMVPTTMEHLKPQLSNFKEVKKKDRELKATKKRNYDARHRISKQAILEPGDEAWITDQNKNGEVGRHGGTEIICHTYTLWYC